jgi:hypothetical protein
MRVPLAIDFVRANLIAPPIARVGALVVSDRPTVGGATSKTTGSSFLDFTGPEAFLARKCVAYRVTIGAVEVGCLRCVSGTSLCNMG